MSYASKNQRKFKSLGETKCMYLLVEDCKLLKNVIQSGIKSVIVLKKDLIANQSIMKKKKTTTIKS